MNALIILSVVLVGQLDRTSFSMLGPEEQPKLIAKASVNRFDDWPSFKDELEKVAEELAIKYKDNSSGIRRMLVKKNLINYEYGLENLKGPFNKSELKTINKVVEKYCKIHDTPKKKIKTVDSPVKMWYHNVYTTDPRGVGWKVSLYGIADSNNVIQYDINEQTMEVQNVLRGQYNPTYQYYYFRN